MNKNNYLFIGSGYLAQNFIATNPINPSQIHILTRSLKKASIFKKQGFNPIIGDLCNPNIYLKFPSDIHYILISIASDQKTIGDYQKTYIESMNHFLENYPLNKHHKIIYTSSTGVWPNLQGQIIDEYFPITPDSPFGDILFKAEQQLLKAAPSSNIIRLGGIYGPLRNRISYLKNHSLISLNHRWINLIHIKDACRLIQFLFNHFMDGEIYLGVDDQPTLQSKYYQWIIQQLQLSTQFKHSYNETVSGKICSNRKIKKLGFNFIFSDFKKGYQEIISQEFS